MTRTVSNAFHEEIARLASSRDVHAAFSWFHVHEELLRRLQAELVGIPAPPFGEGPRAAWLRARFEESGLDEVTVDAAGNVLGLLRGAPDGASPCVAVTAHIDTVFPPDLKYEAVRSGSRLYAPGASDNAPGVTALLGLARACRAAGVTPRCDLLLVGNVGEEGEGDLRGVRHLFHHSGWGERIGAMLVLDGTGTETIVTQGLGSRRFEIEICGPGGHSWTDFGLPNPVVVLANIVAQFSRTPVPPEPRTTFNFGTVEGGTSVNSIPERAAVRVDLRSTATSQIERLEQELRHIVQEVVHDSLPIRPRGRRPIPLTAKIVQIGDRPAAELPADAPIYRLLKAVDAHLNIRSERRVASTDANIPLALGRPALSIGAGGSGGGTHTSGEWFDATGRDLALRRILLAVLALASHVAGDVHAPSSAVQTRSGL